MRNVFTEHPRPWSIRYRPIDFECIIGGFNKPCIFDGNNKLVSYEHEYGINMYLLFDLYCLAIGENQITKKETEDANSTN